MEKLKVTISGMSCEHCVKRVEEAVESLNGVDKIKVNLKKGEAKIKYDEALASSHQIIESIANAGYEAVLV